MRISTISSSFAAVVARVIDSVAVAGIAVRTMFLHTETRELRASEVLRNWQRCQSQFGTWNYPGSDYDPGHKPGLMRLIGIHQPVVCPAPTRLTGGRSGGRG